MYWEGLKTRDKRDRQMGQWNRELRENLERENGNQEDYQSWKVETEERDVKREPAGISE